MRKKDGPKSRAEQILERSNKPILVLAALAVILYILELFRVVPRAWMTPLLWTNFLIDFIFLIDLTAKAIILGRGYLRSPWFMIDFISTLPVISSALELMGALGPQLQATRVARGARVARIARVARVARLAKVARVARLATAIRATQGLTFLKNDTSQQKTPTFNKALFIGVPVLLIGFILVSGRVTQVETNILRQTIEDRLSKIKDVESLDAIQAEFDPANTFNPTTEVELFDSPLVEGEQIALSLSEAYARADRLIGLLLLFVLLTIGVSIGISSSLASDRSKGRERSILSQCFSPSIVNKFYNSPEVIDRFYNQWMTVFFIDIRGFTQQAEKDADDVESLALKLRQVMDTARDQIVVTHEGVIDKFMGDAVMGWVGGHFSAHWNLLNEVREKLCLGELELIEQDIKSIQRGIDKLDPAEEIKEFKKLEKILTEAQKQRTVLFARQQRAIEKDPKLRETHESLTQEYRRRVARSAVTCCLKISIAVEKIEDPDAFHELKIGIGSGRVLVGNFGSTEQIGFTVLGPTVNRSARLEPASAQVGSKILVDEETYELLKDEEDMAFRRIPRISVRGFSNEMVTYEPFFKEQISTDFLETFDHAVEVLEAGHTEEAKKYFEKAVSLRPGGDKAAQIWMEECSKALESGEDVGVKKMKK